VRQKVESRVYVMKVSTGCHYGGSQLDFLGQLEELDVTFVGQGR
jgi:hypothetical protein